MRFYRIEILNTDGSAFRTFASLGTDGIPLPGALNIELDIPVTAYATPIGQTFIRIWGISLQDIGQAVNMNGKYIRVFAGMSKGLPLANPAQAGLIVAGTVQQAFGNWVDTSQTLDLIITAGSPNSGNPVEPLNFTFQWENGTPLSTAIDNTLSTAFPNYKRNINISPNLVNSETETGFFDSLEQFASYLLAISKAIDKTDGYRGVSVLLLEKTFSVFDGTSPTAPKNISFNDLIGQPTWIDPGTIQFKCILRADLLIGDYVKLPKGQVAISAQSLSQYRQGSVFQGVFSITQIRHVGNFRQPDGNAWVTTFDAYPTTGDVPGTSSNAGASSG